MPCLPDLHYQVGEMITIATRLPERCASFGDDMIRVHRSPWNRQHAILFLYIILTWLCAIGIDAVKREDFRTCAQSGFCTRQRAYADLTARQTEESVLASDHLATYRLLQMSINSTSIETGTLRATLESTKQSVTEKWSVVLHCLIDSTFRLQIDEENLEESRRYLPQHTLQEAPRGVTARIIKHTKEYLEIATMKDPTSIIHVAFDPFEIRLDRDGKNVIAFNSKHLLNMEQKGAIKKKRDESTTDTTTEFPIDNNLGDDQNAINVSQNNEETRTLASQRLKALLHQDEWEETFKTWTDTKPNGPTSIAADITFPSSSDLFGLAEHAASHRLKSTIGPARETGYEDPYRLFNTDICNYEIETPMSLYGSVPYIISLDDSGDVSGVFWHNTAETWVDIDTSTSSATTHWMSESGVMDIFFFLGKSPNDVFRQYSRLTGTPFAPPLGVIGYHQCRWNYNDKADVEEVNDLFERYEIPLDVLWLDIEHTDEKKYFTWDAANFPNSTGMLQTLEDSGRFLVNIVDPHLKVDANYEVYESFRKEDLYIKTADGKNLEGHCWPGKSSWPDYTLPRAQELWASMYDYIRYKGTAPNVFIWNDMNEPSVFDRAEVTMSRDALHANGVEHRDVHNLYGMLQVMATFKGLQARDHLAETSSMRRPFILTRSFYAGIQRYSAVWTGDNAAEWSHLKASIPMLLTISVNGIVFNGADVGGFFDNPEPELLTRWYQLGAWTPFFRAHAHIDTKRREPYLLQDPYRTIIFEAIKERYRFLPLWYTLFMHAHFTGIPIMRPMWSVFPHDNVCRGTEGQYMVGEQILVAPVVEQSETRKDIYLPNGLDNWRTWDDLPKDVRVTSNESFGGQWISVQVELSERALLVRRGSVIPWRQSTRRSSRLMHNDPITLSVFVDANGEASGAYYHDDGETDAYMEKGRFLSRKVSWRSDSLYWEPASICAQHECDESNITEKDSDDHFFVWIVEIHVIDQSGESESSSLLDDKGNTICRLKSRTSASAAILSGHRKVYKCTPGRLSVRQTWSLRGR